MATPRERIEQIFKNYTPSEVVFRAKTNHNGGLQLQAVTVKAMEVLPSDDELQAILASQVRQKWDTSQYRNIIHGDADATFDFMKRRIVAEYDRRSPRCKATKRKTENFIHGIKLDDKHLPTFLISMYIKINKPEYSDMERLAKEAFFEPLESLRKTYGKRF